jgi:hypothetical protein
MAINFPSSPSVNAIYTYGGNSWQWDGKSWNSIGANTTITNSYNNSIISPDTRPYLGTSYDDEFEFGTTLDVSGLRFSGANAWNVYSGRSTTGNTTINNGCLIVSNTSLTSANSFAAWIGMPISGSSWKFRMRCSVPLGFSSTNQSLGMFVGSGTKQVDWGHWSTGGAAKQFNGNHWNSYVYSSQVGIVAYSDIYSQEYSWHYLEVELASSTIYFRTSLTGAQNSFTTQYSESLASFLTTTPDAVGLYITGIASTTTLLIDWFRRIDGSIPANTSTAAASAGNPGGSNTQIQFNNASSFGGTANLTFNVATNVFSVGAASNTLIANAVANTVTVGGMIFQSNTIYSNVTIQSGQNGLMAGPITIANGVVITISNGSRFVVL